MKGRNRLIAAAAAAGALVIAAGALAGVALRTDPQVSNVAAQQGPDDFRRYFVGQSFERLQLVKRMRRLDRRVYRGEIRANYVSFLYGSCRPPTGAPCPYPLEVQNWPACERNLSSYSQTPKGPPFRPKRVTIRGAPAAIFEEGYRVEVYTGNTTVVVFATSTGRARRAADAIQSEDGKIKPGEPLPPPVPGALEGKLVCEG
jgi:hypothetical protein